jgi:hypothetical protein
MWSLDLTFAFLGFAGSEPEFFDDESEEVLDNGLSNLLQRNFRLAAAAATRPPQAEVALKGFREFGRRGELTKIFTTGGLEKSTGQELHFEKVLKNDFPKFEIEF